MKSILTVIGTRPEAIKLSPVLNAFAKNKSLKSEVCITLQHTDLLEPFVEQLDIRPDYKLPSVEGKSSLHCCTAHILHQLEGVLKEAKPDVVVVQGDTATTFAATLAAFYSHIPVAHIEAGLRTGNLYSPWPEEGHRVAIDQLSTFLFAPTVSARDQLLKEGIPAKKIWVVGNTSIDALMLAQDAIGHVTNVDEQTVLVTIHRRENHGAPLKEICRAVLALANLFPHVQFLFFLHPNPAVREPITKLLSGVPNVKLQEPVDHFTFIELLKTCLFVITDSGGIQEEASFFGKPLIIPRDTTERSEGIDENTARLVGTKTETIVFHCRDLLENKSSLQAMSKVHYSYGDGHAAERIASLLGSEMKLQSHVSGKQCALSDELNARDTQVESKALL